MADGDNARLNKMEESTEESEASSFIRGGIDGKRSGTFHLDDCGNARGKKCSSSRKLVERLHRPLLLVAAAVVVTVLTFFIAPDRSAQVSVSPAAGISPCGSVVGDEGQQLAPSLEEATDVRPGALGQEEEDQPISPGTETPERSENSEQQLAIPTNIISGSRDIEEEKEQLGLGRQQTIAVGEQAEELQEEVEAVQAQSGEPTRQGYEGAQLEEPTLLPQCYSNPAADPSEGSWKKVGGVEKSPTRPMHLARSKCANIWDREHHGEGPQPYWAWQTSACTLDEVDGPKFCRMMKGRKGLLFAGDSLSHLMTRTLAAVLGAKFLSNPPSNLNYSACGGALKISWYRNDVLDVRTTNFNRNYCEDVTKTSCIVFAKDSILGQFDTLVVNSGLHGLAGGMGAYEDMMTAASKALTSSMRRLHGDSAIFVVRNTVPGHWECSDRMFNGPVDRDVAATLAEEAPAHYEWPAIGEKNKILEEAFTRDDGWKLLDAYAPTVLRADLHIGGEDCLHYCMPGPIDHWVILLYNMLLVETSGGEQ